MWNWLTWKVLKGWALKSLPLGVALAFGFAPGWAINGWRLESKVSNAEMVGTVAEARIDTIRAEDAAQAAIAEAEAWRIKGELDVRIATLEARPPEIVTRIETVVERVPEIAAAPECAGQVGVFARLIAEMHDDN